ncbi:hypothetical protein GCM10027592_60540 [Spirosoma flavus]
MDQVQEAVSELGQKLTQDGIKSQTIYIPTESMADTVLEKAAELQSDLLIITARLATTSDNFFIGPFTQQIIHNALIPVLAIRPESPIEPAVSQHSWQFDQANVDLTAL